MKDGDVSPMPEALTEDDITRFFNVKLHDLKCPACGGDDFRIQFGDNTEFVTFPIGTSKFYSSGIDIKVVIAACNDCFYILPFSYALIAQWAAQQKAGVTNDKV